MFTVVLSIYHIVAPILHQKIDELFGIFLDHQFFQKSSDFRNVQVVVSEIY